ncbi:geranylgeranylglyceryl/heptaprenylglyceryl phosphate synthase [Flavobacterium pallidum]|uniref:Geranylgeranylglyceryl phosphate synthase n=1 Tax=Flavobacterium pallidum TaxID=2172098 RepID=A0A2S1SEM5_9FLAO|nr:geranylgeranylglyceryl/heptaprenylglyceryl phosphate synthase [Flavobacterium pallidum]AWI24858.1 geranylgeranylglyceryl/heptaprenylglyceryl phosphate synthase [Flavobacterium pallidum]
MGNIYNAILSAKKESGKLLAILLDPDKIDWDALELLAQKINISPATHIFIGGSHVSTNRICELVLHFKKESHLPVILFPGNPSQISDKADAILFLSLLSGRNPDFLIGHHVDAAPILTQTNLEIIPTGYILIESGSETAVARVSKTEPLSISDIDKIVHTAVAGQMLGNKLIYLEAGSGAKNAVPFEIIKTVSESIKIPLIVGGGIRTKQGIETAFENGADLVVIGTAFENDIHFFEN